MPCDICGNESFRRMRFTACDHVVCTKCIEDFIWDGRDDHFLCCNEPSCLKCGESTAIIIEADNGTYRTYIDEPDDKVTNGDKKKSV